MFLEINFNLFENGVFLLSSSIFDGLVFNQTITIRKKLFANGIIIDKVKHITKRS